MKTAVNYKMLSLIGMGVMGLAMGCGSLAQDGMTMPTPGASRAESTATSLIPLNPSRASDIGFVYEAFLSPQQEGGEEEETPALIPPQFRSTAPSIPRNQRPDNGHAVLEFTNDLSRAYVFLAVEDVKADDVVMLHLHCGRPGQLGPIIIDFSMAGSLTNYLADGTMSIELTDEDVAAVANSIQSPIDAYTLGCPINPTSADGKVKTIAGLKFIADQGEIYFNLHTKGQVYFGDIRGQFSPVALPK